MKKNSVDYTRKLIVRLAVLIILLGALQESIRHYLMTENFKALREVALMYPAETEEEMMLSEERKRARVTDTLNVTIQIIKLGCLMFVLYDYDRKYFKKKEPD